LIALFKITSHFISVKSGKRWRQLTTLYTFFIWIFNAYSFGRKHSTFLKPQLTMTAI
jgi:hypothetical protein